MEPLAPLSLPARFELDREIGRGGMAVVYRAHDNHLGRDVAIKVLSGGLSGRVGVDRFQREIALMARLVHPGIVALFDSGESDGRLFYVMPLVSGETLRARVSREGRLTPADAASLGADVAEALAYAHGMGIVHRDVKPENIFAVGGRAVLADFGIAHIVSDASGAGATLTMDGTVLGTLSYMSPEQARGEQALDGRSDLYALGCVLYELLTGAPPFVAPTAWAILGKHMAEAPRPLREHCPAVPEELEAIVLRLLAKDPGERPAGAGDVVRLLRMASHTGGPSAPPPGHPETVTIGRGATGRQGTMSEADHLVARGLRAFNLFGGSGGAASRGHLDEARAYLTRALALDPANARGLCAMGNLLSVEGAYGIAPREASLKRGRELIFAALAADDRCAEVHCSMGKVALYYDDDVHAAERHIRRAVELEPSEPEALRLLSIVYKILGRAEDAVDAARAATERTPESAPLWNALGDALLAAGRNAEAIDVLRRAISLLPGYGPALERLERAHAALGEFDPALEIRCSRMRLAGQRERADLLEAEAGALGAAGAIREDLRRELDGLLRQAEALDPFLDNVRRNVADRIASAHAELGEWREAMDWVERAFERRPGRLRRMLADMPVDYRGLAVDPRYARVMRVAGLDEFDLAIRRRRPPPTPRAGQAALTPVRLCPMPSGASRESWLDRLGLNRPELRAWAMYDWANSAFWTTVIAVVFPQYFARVLAADLPAGQATSYFAWTSALAVAVVAAIAPVLGAIADYAALKKRMLAFFIGIGVVSTAVPVVRRARRLAVGPVPVRDGQHRRGGQHHVLRFAAAAHRGAARSRSRLVVRLRHRVPGRGPPADRQRGLDREARVVRHAWRHVPGRGSRS